MPFLNLHVSNSPNRLCQIDCEWKMKMFRSCEKLPKVSFRDSVLIVKGVLSREIAFLDLHVSNSPKHFWRAEFGEFNKLRTCVNFFWISTHAKIKHMVHQRKFSLGKKKALQNILMDSWTLKKLIDKIIKKMRKKISFYLFIICAEFGPFLMANMNFLSKAFLFQSFGFKIIKGFEYLCFNSFNRWRKN